MISLEQARGRIFSSENNIHVFADKVNNQGLKMTDRVNLRLRPTQFDYDYVEHFDFFAKSWISILPKLENEHDKQLIGWVLGRYVDDLAEKQKLDLDMTDQQRVKTIDLMTACYDHGDEKLKQQAKSFLEEEVDFIGDVSKMRSSKEWQSLWSFKFDRMIEGGALGEKLRKSVGEHMQLGIGGEKIIIDTVLSDEFIESHGELIKPYLKLMAEVAGLPVEISDDVVCSWLTLNRELLNKDGDEVYKGRLRRAVKKNIKSILEICSRSQEFGSQVILDLYKQFGITHFGRYSSDILIDQWNNRDNLSSGYGLWVGCYDDYNGSFYQNIDKIDLLSDDAAILGMKMRIIESRDKTSLAKRIYNLDKKYGENNKISFMVISGHGSADSVQLGNFGNTDSSITTADLYGRSANKMKKFYSQRMPVAFAACSTGIDGGIAQHYSIFTGGHAVGPRDVSSLDTISLARRKRGAIYFIGITYHYAQREDYLSGEKL
ncbi:MAG: hypothetical protein WAV41_02770 [Microgenomates group bacterium]